MQVFQPRPLQQGPSTGPVSSAPQIDPETWKKVGKILAIIIIVIIVVLLLRSIGAKKSSQIQTPPERPANTVFNNEVQITQPLANESVKLPFYIIGTARANWFTNGVFPVEVYDGRNNLLTTTYAIADVAPLDGGVATFRAIIEKFDHSPETRIGRIVLHRQSVREKPSSGDIASIGVDFSLINVVVNPIDDQSPITKEDKKLTTDPITKFQQIKQQNSSTGTNTSPKPTTGVQDADPKSSDPAGSNTCNDGRDNDNDSRIDSEDPDCHSDNDQGNNASYDGTRDENPKKQTPIPTDTSGPVKANGSVWTKQQWTTP